MDMHLADQERNKRSPGRVLTYSTFSSRSIMPQLAATSRIVIWVLGLSSLLFAWQKLIRSAVCTCGMSTLISGSDCKRRITSDDMTHVPIDTVVGAKSVQCAVLNVLVRRGSESDPPIAQLTCTPCIVSINVCHGTMRLFHLLLSSKSRVTPWNVPIQRRFSGFAKSAHICWYVSAIST